MVRTRRIDKHVYDALRQHGTVSATELADEGIKRKGIATHDRATRREFASKFHNLLQHMGRRGQLDKIGSGQGALEARAGRA
jgi:hypothetical protein